MVCGGVRYARWVLWKATYCGSSRGRTDGWMGCLISLFVEFGARRIVGLDMASAASRDTDDSQRVGLGVNPDMTGFVRGFSMTRIQKSEVMRASFLA